MWGRKLSSPTATTAFENPTTDNTNNDTITTTNNKNISLKVDSELLAMMKKNQQLKLVGAIDQGTSSTRFVVFDASKGKIAVVAQMEHEQLFFPSQHPGWHEHDPYEIWSNVQTLMVAVATKLQELEEADEQEEAEGASTKRYRYQLAAIGITNQRETTVAWNKLTGKLYYNAIVWDDTRTEHIVHNLQKGHSLGRDRVREQTGLPLATYFAGVKVKWLLDHVPELQNDLKNPLTADQVCVGTMDSWLLYQLTGTTKRKSNNSRTTTFSSNIGGVHCTDVTNASRWLFLNLARPTEWDPDLVNLVCAPRVLPLSALPTICPSSHIYGHVRKECGAIGALPFFENVPLASILGDQQAALFGQTAFAPGEAKNTYGTGLFLMMNTGTVPIKSKHGLLTTIAYQIGNDQVYYALEGSVSHAGSTLQFLRDQLQIIKDASESEVLATPQNDGLYFVPAFAGLFAPHWRSDARACIVGMSASHHKGHVLRAALEAAAYQTKEVFDAIVQDSGVVLHKLNVDGGMTHNSLLMQFQADLLRVPVVQPAVMETTSLGAAFAAGLAVGVWKDLDEIRALWGVAKVYEPSMSDKLVHQNWAGWQKAVTRSWDWVLDDDNNNHNSDDKGEGADDASSEGSVYQDAWDHISVGAAAAGNEKPTSSGGKNGIIGGILANRWTLVSIALTAGVAAFIGYEAGRASTSSTTRPRIK